MNHIYCILHILRSLLGVPNTQWPAVCYTRQRNRRYGRIQGNRQIRDGGDGEGQENVESSLLEKENLTR